MQYYSPQAAQARQQAESQAAAERWEREYEARRANPATGADLAFLLRQKAAAEARGINLNTPAWRMAFARLP